MHHIKGQRKHSGSAMVRAPMVQVYRKWWLTVEDMSYSHGDILEVYIKRYFLCDLASIPWFVRWLLSTSSDGVYDAVIHDFLLSRKVVSRTLADAIFREAMIHSSVPKWKRRSMYIGVRIGAILPWSNNPPPEAIAAANEEIRRREGYLP